VKQIYLVFACLLSAIGARGQLLDMMPPIQQDVFGTPESGYILLSTTSLDMTGSWPTNLAILDSVGNYLFFMPVTSQTIAPFTIERGLVNFEVEENGELSVAWNVSGTTEFQLLDSTLNIVESVACSGYDIDIHDFAASTNGERHIMCVEERFGDLSAFTTISGTQGDTNAVLLGNVIQRFDAGGALVFEWNTLDAFAISDTYFENVFSSHIYLDHAHVNAFEIDTDGHYLVSSRALNEITKINSTTGQIIWRLGGKNNMFTFISDTVEFTAQHDIRRLNNGNISIFDNAGNSTVPIARGVEYALDTVNWTATLVWEFKNPFNVPSGFIGSSRRLPQGNTMIDWGGIFPLNTTTSFSEVDAAGNIVMDLDLPDRYISYRAPKEVLPFSLPHPTIDCNDSMLVAPAGFSEYYWSSGETGSTITPSAVGTYYVWVDFGVGYLRSFPFEVDTLTSVCGTIGIETTEKQLFKIYPNPASAFVNIEFQDGEFELSALSIIDISGKTVRRNTQALGGNRVQIDVSKMPAGVYVIRYGHQRQLFVKSE
jgi:hypothetical protein